MMRAFLFAAVFMAFARPAFAELHTGFGFSSPGWDFSTQQVVQFFEADIFTAVVDPPGGLFVTSLNGTTIAILQMPFDDVTEAPADPALYLTEQVVDLIDPFSATYVVLTPEGHYAKFSFVPDLGLDFEYAYQDDGSRILAPTVPVEAASWGRVKALYQ